MNKVVCFVIVCFTVVCVGVGKVSAQEVEGPWSLSAEVNALSLYEWRGQMTSGLSFQPEVTVNYSFPSIDIYANVWFDHSFARGLFLFDSSNGTTNLVGCAPYYEDYDANSVLPCGTNYKSDEVERTSYSELDFTLGLCWKGLDFSLASYWCPLYNGDGATTCALDATLGYTFDFGLGLSWSTLLFDPSSCSKRYHSSYCEVSYSHPVWVLDLGARVGIVPWNSPYIDDVKEFHIAKVALEVGHTFTFKDERFAVPVGLNVLLNQAKQFGLQLTAGFTFDTNL